MRQRGRKSAANLATLRIHDARQAHLDPPVTLSEAEQSLFTQLVAANTPEHFRSSDVPLLVSYVQAAILGEQAANELRRGAVVDGKVNPWIVIQEKCVRALVSLSMRLRLSPQSRLDPKTLGRQPAYQGPPPWAIHRSD